MDCRIYLAAGGGVTWRLGREKRVDVSGAWRVHRSMTYATYEHGSLAAREGSSDGEPCQQTATGEVTVTVKVVATSASE